MLVVTCCRADYLERTMKSITSNLNGYTPTIYISQDKNEADVTARIEKWLSSEFKVKHLRHPPANLDDVPPGQQRSYHLIARHFGWALGQLFDVYGHSKVIILEDDMEVARTPIPSFGTHTTLHCTVD
eukprot:SAG31_NODE_3596_length_4087_cov_28.925025_4_plen_128_part_00